MKNAHTTVLLVEDEAALRRLIETSLRKRGYVVRSFSDAESAFADLDGGDIDVVLTDVVLGGTSGIDLCRHVNEHYPELPVVVTTAFGSMDAAVGALRAGAYDFLPKPVDIELLELTIRRAAERHRLQREVKMLRRRARVAEGFGELVGESDPMRELFHMISRVALAPSSVVVAGESGSGKELVARALHDSGPRKNGPFVALNCAAVPESLLESELFGHVRGAFTDARTDRRGLFAEATGGTIFLDEIGDMPLGLQPKLLRVLQEGKVRPVGGDRTIDVDVRIVAATHRDLGLLVREGQFREDLFFRLDVIRIEVPPLRARGADILLLAQHFIDTLASKLGSGVRCIDPAAARRLLTYPWPGNVRELRNCIERALVLAEGECLVLEDLSEGIRGFQDASRAAGGVDETSSLLSLAEVERRHIEKVMRAVGGNRGQAALTLGVDRKTLYRKLKELE